MNTKDKRKVIARTATKGIATLAVKLGGGRGRPPGFLLIMNFYKEEEATMATKFHAGHFKNGDSTERKRNGRSQGNE